jgi:hypothetical protein
MWKLAWPAQSQFTAFHLSGITDEPLLQDGHLHILYWITIVLQTYAKNYKHDNVENLGPYDW